jgi:rhodanese-related sulfurtransferase
MPTSDELRLSPSEVHARVREGRAIVLDVVQPDGWADLDQVIAGALRIPPDDVERRIEELPVERDVITYCA